MRVEETMADLLQATSVSRTCFSDRRDHIQTSYVAPEGNRVSLRHLIGDFLLIRGCLTAPS